jgi:tetratricopeptide (TPR) repeat protein
VLRAGTVVKGSVEEDAGQLRISAELVDGGSGASFQRESFHVPRNAPLSARDSLAGAVAELLRQRLGDEIRLQEQRNASNNADAWVLVQRVEKARKDATRLAAENDFAGLERVLANADSMAADAARLDPHWAQPMLERGHMALGESRLVRQPHGAAALLDTVIHYANQALAIDPRNAEAFELRGTARFERVRRELLVDQREIERMVAAADSDLHAAVEIEPRRASAWSQLSIVEYGKNNVVEANNAARRAYEADAYLRAAPDILSMLWGTSYDLEQFPDAIHWCAVGGQRFPDDQRFTFCRLFDMLTTAVENNPAEAWRQVSNLTRLAPKPTQEFTRREGEIIAAVVVGRAGLRDSAHKVLERARAGPSIDPEGDLIGLEALARTMLGEHDEAIALLERYLTNHPDHRGLLKVHAWWWRDLQKDPRITKLAGAGR